MCLDSSIRIESLVRYLQQIIVIRFEGALHFAKRSEEVGSGVDLQGL